jgi:YjbE family integral membrane protein
MSPDTLTLLFQILEIVWINILLSGDNAVVIALACRSLPEERRRFGIFFGAGAAVALRLVFTLLVVELLALPFVKIVGGLLLLWIAIKLVVDDEPDKDIKSSSSIWGAVQTIAIADAVMSLDNVVAIAAAAGGSRPLIFFGLALSIPLIVFGSSLLLGIIERFPILVWAGAALLGWVAGELVESDPHLTPWLHNVHPSLPVWFAPAGAALVLLVAGLIRARHASMLGPDRMN